MSDNRKRGASHPKAKHSDLMIEWCRQWADVGLNSDRIAELLKDVFGVTVSRWTIRDWVDYRTRGLV